MVQNGNFLADLEGCVAMLDVFHDLAFCRIKLYIGMILAVGFPNNNTVRARGGLDEFNPVFYAFAGK